MHTSVCASQSDEIASVRSKAKDVVDPGGLAWGAVLPSLPPELHPKAPASHEGKKLWKNLEIIYTHEGDTTDLNCISILNIPSAVFSVSSCSAVR